MSVGAEVARAAGVVERRDHPVTLLEPGDFAPYLLDDPAILVAQDAG
jgi:hypothetical protein